MEDYEKAHNLSEINIKLLKLSSKKLNRLTIDTEFIKIDENFQECWSNYEDEIEYSELQRKLIINIPKKYHNQLYYNDGDYCIYFRDGSSTLEKVFIRRSDDDSFLPVDNIVELFKEEYIPLPRIEKVYKKCAEELKAEQEVKIMYG